MKIKMKQRVSTPLGLKSKGEVLDLNEVTANEYVKKGLAEKVEEKVKEKEAAKDYSTKEDPKSKKRLTK